VCLGCDGQRRKHGLTCEPCHYSSKTRDKNQKLLKAAGLLPEGQETPMTDDSFASWKETTGLLEYLMAEEKKLVSGVPAEQSNDNRLLQFLLSTDLAGVSTLLRAAPPYVPQYQAFPPAPAVGEIPRQLMPPDHMPMPLQPLTMSPSPPTTPTHAYDTSYSGSMPCVCELDEATTQDNWWHISN